MRAKSSPATQSERSVETRRWVTLEKAEELTGLGVPFFHKRTGNSGDWPEGQVWKWFEGRKLIDIDALYQLIDKVPGIPSSRGRRRSETWQEHEAATTSP